jgi:nucleoside-diphosphate-sugar epimerase
MIFIIGGKGLTGSALVKYAENNDLEYKIIQKENKEDFFGKSCDLLIFANGNAVKFQANEDPLFDFHASISSIVEYIHKINYKQFILLSTVDVYNNKDSENYTNEECDIIETKLEPYGFHKYLAEKFVIKYCPNYLIFRLGGLVGEGLKKNPVYYYVKKNTKVTVSPKSQMNFINTRLVAESIFTIINKGEKNEIFNLASKNSIEIEKIKKIINYESKFSDDASQNIMNYIINTDKIQQFLNLSTSEESIKEYFYKLNSENN